MKYITSSSAETKKLAAKMAKQFQLGGIIALSGKLGAGKTTFVQGFARGLGVTGKLISPTFVIVKSYQIPGRIGGRLFHIDLYRLISGKQVNLIGLKDIFSNKANIVLIEWAERLESSLPKGTCWVKIQYTEGKKREIWFEE